ncbi:MAG: hypothetical protein M3144_03425 [Actinomycetota bacterium]|nr:hypothetical protein [Actinomycetota bacterium]
MSSERRWWVFDRPLGRDWLFVTGVIAGALALVLTLFNRDDYGAGAFVLTLLLAVPSGILAAGTFGGTIREFVRGRRSAG